jgi:hypothetical protein
VLWLERFGKVLSPSWVGGWYLFGVDFSGVPYKVLVWLVHGGGSLQVGRSELPTMCLLMY